MIDWASAADRFVDSGDGTQLAEILKKSSKNKAPWLDASMEPARLEEIADDLTQLSFALTLNRLEESVQCYLSLKEHLGEDASSHGNTAQVTNPFRILSDRLVDFYGDLSENNVQNQLALIQWHLRNDNIAQAVLLSREWLISIAFDYFPIDKAGRNDFEERKKVADWLTAADTNSALSIKGVTLGELKGSFNRVRGIRNDIAHCSGITSVKEITECMKKEIGIMKGIVKRISR